VGQKIANCALTIKARVVLQEGLKPETNLSAARVCNTRLCPFCEWRRSRVWRKRLYGGLSGFYEDHPKRIGLFLTLTVRNCLLEDLGQTLDDMNAGWNRFIKRSFFPTEFWFRRTEITVGTSTGTGPLFAHPHFHALLLVRPDYFSRNYVKQLEWQKQWMDSARLDYAPVVGVQRAKTKSQSGCSTSEAARSAVVEAAKYSTKATALMELGDAIGEFHRQLRNRRLYAVSRPLSKYIKAGEIAAAEMMDDDSKPLPQGAEAIDVLAQWFEDTQDYVITDMSDPPMSRSLPSSAGL
jgi:plasmid rolling circle replication initiator protein Rep